MLEMIGRVIVILLLSGLAVWLFGQPFLYTYRLTTVGIDIFLVRLIKLYHIGIEDIRYVRTDKTFSVARRLTLHERLRSKIILTKFFPSRLVLIETTGRIKLWILSPDDPERFVGVIRNYLKTGAV